MNQSELQELITLVREQAQQHIMSRFRQVDYRLKRDGSVITEADTAMQNALLQHLQHNWPDYALLGEEMTPEQQAQLLSSPGEGLWIVDPLDGTSNFASGIPIFSVSIALIQHQQVTMGLIYDPVRDECFSALSDQGAWLNEQVLKLDDNRSELKQCIAQVDLKRLPKSMAVALADTHPYASQRNFGSGALDWCWLAAARSQLYVHGGQKLWDYAAGHLILKEAGGYSQTFEGEPLFDNSLQPRSIIAAINDVLFEKWRACLVDQTVAQVMI